MAQIFWMLCVALLSSGAAQESPPWISLEYTMDEELDPGTSVGNLAEDSGLLATPQGDDAPTSSLQFNFLQQDNQFQDLFELEERSGLLKTARRVDRDAICTNADKCDLVLDVGVVGQDRESFDIVKVTIHVRDLNDNAPQWSQVEEDAPLRIVVPENSNPGMTFSIPKARDSDAGAFAIQRYRFEADAAARAKFNLSVTHAADGSVERLSVVLLQRLDREDEGTYSLQVTAVDGGAPPLSGTLAIQVVVHDTNDNSPVFERPTYEATIAEDFPVNMTILQVLAQDADSGLNGQIVYSFDPDNAADEFGINEDTGEIYPTQELDYRTDKNSYRLTVVARDRGENSVPATATVTIHVLDVNNHAPRIRVNALTSSGEVEAPENAPLGTFVAHVDIEDPDEGANGEFTCVLPDPGFELERLYTTIYKIRTSSVFDREKQALYVVRIECEDHGSPPLRSTKQVPITITDANDHDPVFSKPEYLASVQENNAVNAPVIRVNATDKDSGENARITYELQGDEMNLLKIDPDSGVITTRGRFDYEASHTYECEIVAKDNGRPARSATATLVVTVMDVNDEAPHFTQETFDFATFENQPIGTEIGSVSATDTDTAPNNEIRFYIDPVFGSADTFSIDQYTGLIKTTKVLDREFKTLYEFVVVASNPGYDSLSSSASVSVHVADVNDNAPMITFPHPGNNSLQVPISAKKGFIFAKIHAEDPDVGQNSQLSFMMAKGNDEGVFDIDEGTGILSVLVPAREAAKETYHLMVTVADHGQPPKTAMVEVNVLINHTAVILPGAEHQGHFGTGLNQNQTILIALSLVTLVLVVILIVAIICVKRSGIKAQKQRESQDQEMVGVSLDSRHAQLSEKMQPLNAYGGGGGSDRDDDSNSSVDHGAAPHVGLTGRAHPQPPPPPHYPAPTPPMQEMRYAQPPGQHDLNSSLSLPDDERHLQVLQVDRSSLRGSGRLHPRPNGIPPAGPVGTGPVGAQRPRLVTTAHDILSKPWMLTEKELEVHRMLQSGGRSLGAGRSGVGTLGPGPSGGGAGGAPGDEDSSSGCSNTDSGRGASEDGEQRARTPNKDEDGRPPVLGRRKRNLQGALLGGADGGGGGGGGGARQPQYSGQRLQTFGEKPPPPAVGRYADSLTPPPPPVPQRQNVETRKTLGPAPHRTPYAGSNQILNNSPYHSTPGLVNNPNILNNNQSSRTPGFHGSFHERIPNGDHNQNVSSIQRPNSFQVNNDVRGSMGSTSTDTTCSSDSSLTLVNSSNNFARPSNKPGYMDSVV